MEQKGMTSILGAQMKRFVSSEKGLVALVSLCLIFLTALPYAYGWMMQSDDWRYMWTHSLAVTDFFVYHTYINQIAAGDFFPNNMYTHESTVGILQIVWFAPALFVKILNIDAAVALQLFRVLLVPFGIAMLYAFVRMVVPRGRGRILALVFLIFSSGVGFMAPLAHWLPRESRHGGYNWPMDLWVGESNTFLTLLRTPHILLSLILLASTFLFGILYFTSGNRRHWIKASACAFVLMWIHPFYVVTIVAVLGAYALYGLLLRFSERRRAAWLWLVCSASTVPGVVYYAWLYFTDQGFHIKASQNLLYTPPLVYTFLSYGGLAVLALIAIARYWRSENITLRFCVVWSVVGGLLLYAPLTFQRRLTEGLHIPLALLSFQVLYPFIVKRLRVVGMSFVTIMTLFVTVLFSISNLAIYVQDFDLLSQRASLLFLPMREVRAAEWIAEHTPEDDVLFSPEEKGWWLPSIARRRVYRGHWVETLNSASKYRVVEEVYATRGQRGLEAIASTVDVMWVEDEGMRDTLFAKGMTILYDNEGVWLLSTHGVWQE